MAALVSPVLRTLSVSTLLIATRCSSLSLRPQHFANRATLGATGLRMTSSDQTAKRSVKRIFCYGDSLTAGTTTSLSTFPYGPHLEDEINRSLSPGDPDAAVRWRGLPGWTASAMADALDDPGTGLRSALEGIRDPSLSVVVILAGTNDIGSLTSTVFGGRGNVEGKPDGGAAAEPTLRLHEACLDHAGDRGRREVRTVAVAIPGSAWQDANPGAAALCGEMNDSLREFASSRERVTFVDFPFPYGRGDPKWSNDGLHLSAEGYQALGRSLAPCIKRILGSMEMSDVNS